MSVEIVSAAVFRGLDESDAVQRNDMTPFGTAVKTNDALYSLATLVGVPGSSLESFPDASSAAILTLAGSTGFAPLSVEVLATHKALTVSPTNTPSEVGSDNALGLVTFTRGAPRSLVPEPPDPVDPPEPVDP